MNRTDPRPRRFTLAASVAACTALLAGCTGTDAATSTTTSPDASTTAPAQVRSATPRLAVTYDGGVLVLDAETLTVVNESELSGFNRLSPAGDDRHVIVSTAGGFRVLDTGTWSQTHGDHAHHYTAAPTLTDIMFGADEPGHVVRHAGRTVLFDDGTGRIASFDPTALADGVPPTSTFTTPHPHHGAAVELPDGRLITTLGDETARTGIVVYDAGRTEIARNEQCPGVHGEAIAADGAVVFGCQDGLLIYRDGAITKITSPDPYGRIGNQAGSEASPVMLGDYKTDPDAKLERPERVSLTDTVTGELHLVDLGTSYTFRSLGRGPFGEALVLGTDGALHVLDASSGAVLRRLPVVDPWTEPVQWQTPRPALFVQGFTAYVTDPTTQRIHAVDIETGEVTTSAELPHTPDEITGVHG
ncbi:zinc metallochaperone AztD [Prescottella subtropica]|uniref:zinc metallochaperone AztD n=1 Tax=Prescottella subtropica TaxID=2545757 RepID=UPI0010F7CC37|nr:zinc metallochaperone AztD [Prescottella subtropica]